MTGRILVGDTGLNSLNPYIFYSSVHENECTELFTIIKYVLITRAVGIISVERFQVAVGPVSFKYSLRT